MLAHQIDDSLRTKDVTVVENVTFESLLLSENVLKGLTNNGFKKPSPIQLKAIPVGRCGFDLIVKSKSGTGKTLVFSIIALESLKAKPKHLEVLILSPTREIAVQSQDVIKKIGCLFNGLKVESFIGGLSLAQDKENCKHCHIALGTPGRIKHLIKEKVLITDSIRLFILDEADKLMEQSFRNDINEIYNSLPEKKQLITTSATYPNQLDEFLSNYMLSPTHITAELDSPLLLGLKQFVVTTTHHSNIVQQMKTKTEELVNLLTNISFTQCLIFSNYQTRAESLSNILNQKGWPATYISAAQTQVQRLTAVNELKDFKCRIMLSTDLTARGIDAANVDLVINYDIPNDAMTYLHRMGRAGRYGSSGVCINLASEGPELIQLQEILGCIGGSSLTIPKLPKFFGNILELIKFDILPENHIPSIIDTNKNIAAFTGKMYEMKTEKKSKNQNKNETKQKKSKNKVVNESESLESDKLKSETLKNVDININTVLNNSKLEEDAIRQQIFDMESESILDSLLNQNFQLEPKTETPKKDFDAKAVMDLLTGTCSTKPEPHIKTKTLETNSEDQQKEKLIIKNKALFDVSKILTDTHIQKDDTAIGQHLSFLKAQEKYELRELSKKNMSDILNILEQKEFPSDISESINLETSVVEEQIEDESSNPQLCNEGDGIPSTSKSTIDDKYFDLENVFEFGLEHFIKSDNDDWEKVLETFKKPNKENEDIVDEEEEDYMDDDDYEEAKDDDYEDAEDDDYEDSEECNEYTKEIDNYEDTNIMKWVPVEPTKKSKNSTTYDIRENVANEVDITKWVPVETKEDTESNDKPTYLFQSQEDSSDTDKFNGYFEECSNNLWQNGLSFSNFETFDNWFYCEWDAQLNAVRNFVQQNIYVKEMAEYQNSKYGT